MIKRRHPLPVIEVPKRTTVATNLDPDLLEAFMHFENELGLTRSAALRLALREYLTLIGYFADQPSEPAQVEALNAQSSDN